MSGGRHAQPLALQPQTFALLADNARPTPGGSVAPWPASTNFIPCCLTNARSPSTSQGWIYELKMDGYRLLAEFDGTVQLRTRSGTDTTKWFPEITQSLAMVKAGQCVADGEVCVLDELGRSDFN